MIFRFTPHYKHFQTYNVYNSIVVIAPNKEDAIQFVNEKFNDKGSENDREAFKAARIEEVVDDGNTTDCICEDYVEA